MDDITLNLIVIASFALIGLAIFLLVRRKQSESEQGINRMAAEYGWTSENIREPLAWGLRLRSNRSRMCGSRTFRPTPPQR
jgi:LPXTG-motif cell wall-anchored protein